MEINPMLVDMADMEVESAAQGTAPRLRIRHPLCKVMMVSIELGERTINVSTLTMLDMMAN